MRLLAATLASLLVSSAAFGDDATTPPPPEAPAPAGEPPPPAAVATPPVPAPTKATVSVVVTDLRNDAGLVRAAVYRTKGDYLKKESDVASARIQGGKATIVLKDIDPGVAVVRVFHDEDEDGKINSNWIGMPKEGVGVSKDAKGFMGPPKFDDAKLELPPGATSITVKLHYL